MAIIQGEGLELSEVPREQWDGTTHPGRLRFQSFRPGHPEPLTDALIGQGRMSLDGGGFPRTLQVGQSITGRMTLATDEDTDLAQAAPKLQIAVDGELLVYPVTGKVTSTATPLGARRAASSV
jgi:hypothetical protein